MEGNPRQTRQGVSGVFSLIPGLQKSRKYVSARFPQGPSPLSRTADVLLGTQQQKGPPSKQRESALPSALLLSDKQQPANALNKQMQGVPRVDASSNNYFVLMKSGKDFSVYPLGANYTFKAYTRPTNLDDNEAEAKQRGSAAAGRAAADAVLLLPKSMRQQIREQEANAAADKQLQEEALPLLKDKVAELAAKYGGSSSKLVVHASDEEKESDDDMDFEGYSDDDRPGKRSKGKAAANKTDGKTAKEAKATDRALGEFEAELANDIYEGEEDELRPVNPKGEDADWEFAEEAADDDLAQGASDEEGLEDDPGYRREIGLESDEEEEDEKEKQERLEKEAAEAAKAKAAAAAAQPSGAAAAEGDAETGDAAAAGDDEYMDDDAELLVVGDDDEFDADDLDRLAEETEIGDPQQALKRRKGSAGRYRSPAPGSAVTRGATPPASAAGRDSTPTGSKRAATPPSAAVAAALAASSRGATPPAAAVGKGRLTPPPGPSAASATAPGRRLTPPPVAGGGAKRKREAGSGSESGVPSAGTAAAAAAVGGSGGGGQGAWNWSADQLDEQGVPTTEGIIQALSQMGPIPTEKLGILQERLALGAVSADGKALLKKRLLQVAKVEKDAQGRKYMVLK